MIKKSGCWISTHKDKEYFIDNKKCEEEDYKLYLVRERFEINKK